MRWALVLALAAACGANGNAQPAPAATPDWMSGFWLSCENGVKTAETWIGAGSGALVGVNHTQSDRAAFEFIRIAPNAQGRLAYFAMPNGASVTEFAMASEDAERIVFENPQHDFPQRIIYARKGDELTARVEGEINGQLQGQEWRFRRADVDAPCG